MSQNSFLLNENTLLTNLLKYAILFCYLEDCAHRLRFSHFGCGLANSLLRDYSKQRNAPYFLKALTHLLGHRLRFVTILSFTECGGYRWGSETVQFRTTHILHKQGEIRMKNLRVLFAVLVSFLAFNATACALDSDTPTPTTVVVATPGGCRSPKPTPPVVPLPEVPDGRLLPLEVTLSPTTPPSAILIGGRDTPALFTRYRVRNPNNVRVRLTGAVATQMSPDGDIADFRKVGIESYRGISFGHPDLMMSDVEINLSLTPSSSELPEVSAKSEIELKVLGWMSNVLPSSVVSGAWHGVARSGHTPSLQLTRLTTKEAGIAKIVSHDAPIMVLRKSQPIVTVLPLPSTTLANIDMPVFRWQVGADRAGSIGLKQLYLAFKKTAGLALLGVSLRRNGAYIPGGTYDTVVYYGPSPKDIASEIGADRLSGLIIVYFVDEESISGDGNVYTLEAIVAGAKPWQKFEIGFAKPLTPRSVTGQLVIRDGFFAIQLADGTPVISTGLWTDRSEVPHFGGSFDWTNEYLVRGLSGSVTLSL